MSVIAICLSTSFASEVDTSKEASDSEKIRGPYRHFDYSVLLPLTELSIGFQAPIIHRGKLISQLSSMYPSENSDFYSLNYGIGFYFMDVIGVGYEKGFVGSYYVADGSASNRDKISFDYTYSQWLIGGRINVTKPFFDFKYDVLLGYSHGFINSIYVSSDSFFSESITGNKITQKVGLLGAGSTEQFSVEFSSKSNKRRRAFLRVSYNLYSIEGYQSRLENSQTIHISIGAIVL